MLGECFPRALGTSLRRGYVSRDPEIGWETLSEAACGGVGQAVGEACAKVLGWAWPRLFKAEAAGGEQKSRGSQMGAHGPRSQ